MENQLTPYFVIFPVLILSLISNCFGQNQRENKSLAIPCISNSTFGFSYTTHSINPDILNNDLEHRKNTQLKLDKLFRVDSRIFEEYLKDEDLTIIPGRLEDDDFENWTPPLELQRDIPVYISGFDNQDRPIWVFEWGKWRWDKYATGDKEKATLFEKYVRYVSYTIIKSQALRSTKERRVAQYVALRDCEGLLPEYFLNRRVTQFLVKKLFSNYRRFAEKYAGKSIIINVNPIAEVLLNLALVFFKPQLGKTEIYGTNKNIWAPRILKSFPKDQIPEWYGGNKGYVPFRRIG